MLWQYDLGRNDVFSILNNINIKSSRFYLSANKILKSTEKQCLSLISGSGST